MEGYEKLSNLDPKNYKEYEGKNEEVLEVWLKWSRELIKNIDDHDEKPRVPAPVSYAAVAAGCPIKANDALKPVTLTGDNNPVELKFWMNKYRAYCRMSQMYHLTLEDQQAYISRVPGCLLGTNHPEQDWTDYTDFRGRRQLFHPD